MNSNINEEYHLISNGIDESKKIFRFVDKNTGTGFIFSEVENRLLYEINKKGVFGTVYMDNIKFYYNNGNLHNLEDYAIQYNEESKNKYYVNGKRCMDFTSFINSVIIFKINKNFRCDAFIQYIIILNVLGCSGNLNFAKFKIIEHHLFY